MTARRRRFPLRFYAMVLAGAQAAASVAGAETLRELDLSGPSAIGTRIEAAPGENGKPAIRVTAGWPAVINLAEVTDPDAEDTRLVFEARVRSENLAGTAYLEIWAQLPGGGQYFGRGFDSTVTGNAGWTTLRAVFVLQPGQRPSRLILNLVVNGRGVVSIAQAKLSKAPR